MRLRSPLVGIAIATTLVFAPVRQAAMAEDATLQKRIEQLERKIAVLRGRIKELEREKKRDGAAAEAFVEEYVLFVPPTGPFELQEQAFESPKLLEMLKRLHKQNPKAYFTMVLDPQTPAKRMSDAMNLLGEAGFQVMSTVVAEQDPK